ncbi:hypothetical protein Dace_1410 [Desulfuromonas acetoxidans DSM 684]|uniref:Uncharacterized protein n=1 Tax=Desulfuromonas acetoxidans (strain DSM 684 / 11070) TaxID=281689 RepID=Q1JZL9_DESA6|nr:hypothetical protein Dace_1410 [Desulfuromonas acetoxidans DSM 684]
MFCPELTTTRTERNASNKAISRMLKKSRPGIFQRRKPKMRFSPCSQNQGLENLSLILIARPWAPQSVFKQPVRIIEDCLELIL